LNDNTCPYKIVKRANPLVPLLHSLKTANLERIEFNIHNPVLLRLIVCKEEKISTDCPYPDHENSNAFNVLCNYDNFKLAHIYVRHEQIDNIARSCVIVFTKTMYLFDKNELLNLLQNTVNWLDIAQERPYFFIIRYGEPQTTVSTANTNRVLNIELRRIFSGYSKDEDICVIIPVEKQAKLLRIDHTNESKKFRIEPK
jgi:hypothetical protein